MRKQDAISILGCSERVFTQLVLERAIRRVTMRNGHYSYNEDDIRRIANIKTAKTTYTLNLDNLENIDQIMYDINKADNIEIVSSNDELLKVLNAIKGKY